MELNGNDKNECEDLQKLEHILDLRIWTNTKEHIKGKRLLHRRLKIYVFVNKWTVIKGANLPNKRVSLWHVYYKSYCDD